MGAGSEAALVSFPGGWKVLLLWAAGKCARVFVSPLVFGFLLNVRIKIPDDGYGYVFSRWTSWLEAV